MNIDSKGENILRKLADDERNIDYKNLLFKSDSLAINNYDSFKRFGTFGDLLNERINLNKTAIKQNEMIKK